MGAQADSSRSAQRSYARVWRWHFFAASIVIPFVLWQAVTGTLYLWHRELATLAHPELLRVQPAGPRVSYEQQLDTVLGHEPRERLEALEVSDDPERSTTFYFRAANGLPYPAFVDPYSGRYLGSVESTHWIAGLSRGLHGGWPIEPYGSYLLELGASWAIVMALTGLYLWWPRGQGLAGVLYPRLRSGARIFWRDLHATVGAYFAVVLIAFLFTALPWTTLWGGSVLEPVQHALGQASPAGFFFAGGDHHHAAAPQGHAQGAHAQHAHHALPAERRTLDELIASARAAGAHGTIEMQLRAGEPAVNVRDDHPRAPREVWLQLDAHSGAVLTEVRWDDFPAIPKLIALGIDLHEGRFFGRINQLFNTLFALALVWLSVTGFIGWYRRRPQGALGAPPRLALRYPRGVIVAGVALCIALPLLGLSVAAIALLDRVLGRPALARA